jgi:uncharacterized protein YccT (UPF0319 family)
MTTVKMKSQSLGMSKDERRVKHWYKEMEKEGPRKRYEEWVWQQQLEWEERVRGTG